MIVFVSFLPKNADLDFFDCFLMSPKKSNSACRKKNDFSIWFGKIVIGDSPLNVMDKTMKAESPFCLLDVFLFLLLPGGCQYFVYLNYNEGKAVNKHCSIC